jgi:hypothetical protein
LANAALMAGVLVMSTGTAGAAPVGQPDPAATEPTHVAPAARPTLERQAQTEPRAPGGRAAAALIAVVPGALVHGAGSWWLRDNDAAEALLVSEGMGLGAFFGAGAGIVLTGAARSVIGPLAAVTALGAGVFATTWLSDVYNVSVPRSSRGLARVERPAFASRVSVALWDSPQFGSHPVWRQGVSTHQGPVRISVSGEHAPSARAQQWTLGAGYLLLQDQPPSRTRPALAATSFLELRVGGYRREQLDFDFRTHALEGSLSSRLDGKRLAADLSGIFWEFEAGYVWRVTDLAAFSERQTDSLLIARSAFGVYLGSVDRAAGEVQLYYDHRHDGWTEGMLAEGLGSGVLGHAGLSGHFDVSKHWAVTADLEVGSAWLYGLGVRFRGDAP